MFPVRPYPCWSGGINLPRGWRYEPDLEYFQRQPTDSLGFGSAVSAIWLFRPFDSVLDGGHKPRFLAGQSDCAGLEVVAHVGLCRLRSFGAPRHVWRAAR